MSFCHKWTSNPLVLQDEVWRRYGKSVSYNEVDEEGEDNMTWWTLSGTQYYNGLTAMNYTVIPSRSMTIKT